MSRVSIIWLLVYYFKFHVPHYKYFCTCFNLSWDGHLQIFSTGFNISWEGHSQIFSTCFIHSQSVRRKQGIKKVYWMVMIVGMVGEISKTTMELYLLRCSDVKCVRKILYYEKDMWTSTSIICSKFNLTLLGTKIRKAIYWCLMLELLPSIRSVYLFPT